MPVPTRALPELMGILNATPDSFSDGGLHAAPEVAVVAGLAMVADGAAWLDIGGESTRPGALPVAAEEQIRRVVPIIRGLRGAGTQARISVDTTWAAVAEAALDAGADAVNDVSSGSDPQMLPLVAQRGCGLFLMHMQGRPAIMQQSPQYSDVVNEVGDFLAGRVAAARAAGIAAARLYCDPGIGFGKTLAHNLALLQHLPAIAARTGCPLLVGVSRKAFLAVAAGRPQLPAAERDALSHLVHARIARDCAILRVHDVPGTAAALRLTHAFEAA